MAIKVHWDNEAKTIIRQTFDGRWTWDDLYAALACVANMSASVSHRVDAIVDVSRADLIPGGSIFNLNSKRHADKLASRSDLNRGTIVVVGANGLMRTLYDTFRSLYSDKATDVYFVQTLDDARALLNERLVV